MAGKSRDEYRRAQAKATSEAEFQTWILNLAKARRWRLVHFRAALTQSGRWSTPIQGDKGWPDLILCRPPRFLVVELKAEGGSLEAEQKIWLAALEACPGVEVYVLYPSDWFSGAIEEILAWSPGCPLPTGPMKSAISVASVERLREREQERAGSSDPDRPTRATSMSPSRTVGG